jgi:hypothetical protein
MRSCSNPTATACWTCLTGRGQLLTTRYGIGTVYGAAMAEGSGLLSRCSALAGRRAACAGADVGTLMCVAGAPRSSF